MKAYWKVYWALILACALSFGACYSMWNTTSNYRERVSRDATLISAYEYGDRCGYKGSARCSAWKGRFLIKGEDVVVDKDIDGFFYHNFVDKGRQSMPAYVTVSPEELGHKAPRSAWWWGFFTFASAAVGIMIMMMGALMSVFEEA